MTAALEVLGVLMRWTHITCVVLTIGGIAYARLIVFPALTGLAPADRAPVIGEMFRRYRPLVYATLAGILVSGLYNLLSRRGHTSYYHAWFGIKMLLAAHIFAAAVLFVREPKGAQDESRRVRQATGIVISGLIVILISAYLRRIF
jgi:uncharacterized membrane protein